MKKEKGVLYTKRIKPIITKLLEKKGIKVKKFKRTEKGVANEVYFLNSSYILRINTRDRDLKKFENEAKLLRKLKRVSTIPVPKVILFDRVKGFEVLVVSRLKGKPLSAKGFGHERLKGMTLQLARLLKNLHRITSPYFGTFDHRCSRWENYVEFSLKRNIKKALETGSLDKRRINKINQLFSRYWLVLKKIKRKSLVHRDYSFSNILYENDKITGLIDFEWSIYGDFVYDFAILELAVNAYPKIRKKFESSYGKLPLDFELRKDLYKALYLSEIITIDKIFWNSRFRKEMLGQLDEIIHKYNL